VFDQENYLYEFRQLLRSPLSVQVFTRFCKALLEVERLMGEQGGNEFMFNEHIGYVLTCPSNLGTGLRTSVHLKIPKLSAHPK